MGVRAARATAGAQESGTWTVLTRLFAVSMVAPTSALAKGPSWEMASRLKRKSLPELSPAHHFYSPSSNPRPKLISSPNQKLDNRIRGSPLFKFNPSQSTRPRLQAAPNLSLTPLSETSPRFSLPSLFHDLLQSTTGSSTQSPFLPIIGSHGGLSQLPIQARLTRNSLSSPTKKQLKRSLSVPTM